MVTIREKCTLIDLFAGAGGMTRGFVEGGFTPVRAVESDLAAAATYAANFGETHVLHGRIEDFQEVPSADVVIGGPPCQGFSNLGRRDVNDERNSLWREFIRITLAANASAFVFENVSRFRDTPECEGLIQLAESEGYAVLPLILNAADFGTSQARTRAIILGSRIGAIAQPAATHGEHPNAEQRRRRTVRDAIARFPRRPPHDELPERTYSVFGTEAPGPFKLREIHVRRNYRQLSLQRFNRVKPGGNRFDLPDELLPECWKKHKTGSGDVMGRLQWDQPAVTIRTEFFKPEKGRYLHPQWRRFGRRVNRALTHAEAASLQGFDELHVWCGTKVQIARQIGNAVPPPLALALARTLSSHLTTTSTREAEQPAVPIGY